jgi:hypothetical protein
MAEATMQQPEEDLVFICGALRSGTTLLRLMINAHPALSNPGEMDFLFEPPPLQDWRPDMAAYAHELSFNRVFRKLGLKLGADLGYVDQVRDFVRQLRTPGKRLSINVHRNFERIPDIFPEARYVRVLRDPRDVAKSSVAMGWAGNAYFGVDHWMASERALERLLALAAPGRVHQLRYEDLLRSPQEQLAALCGFLGTIYDSSMLSYPNRTTYGAPDPKLIGRWKTDLSPREIGLVEGKVGAMLKERGYEPSCATPVIPGPFRKRMLALENRLGRWRFSVRRNGLGLTALDLISRRLPIPQLRDFARRRLGEKEAAHLK